MHTDAQDAWEVHGRYLAAMQTCKVVRERLAKREGALREMEQRLEEGRAQANSQEEEARVRAEVTQLQEEVRPAESLVWGVWLKLKSGDPASAPVLAGRARLTRRTVPPAVCVVAVHDPPSEV